MGSAQFNRYLVIGGVVVAVLVVGIIFFSHHANHNDGGPMDHQMMNQQAALPQNGAASLEATTNQIAQALDNVTVSIYNGDPKLKTSQLLGSGIVISNQRILTNYHVVENAVPYVKIFSPVKKSYAASVLMSDINADVAILQSGADVVISPAVFGDSDNVNAGDMVFSMGNAFGLGNAFTAGVVCDTQQFFTVNGTGYKNMIQMEMRVRPGASGGPLANINGQVVGMVTAISDNGGDFKGVGFATPVNKILALPSVLSAGGI